MQALSYASQHASPAHPRCAERMSACQPMFAASMCMGAASAASAIIIRTDVAASVFLFVVVLLLCSLLLVSLVVLIISLLLTGLTGLISLEGLVGQGIRLNASLTQGD